MNVVTQFPAARDSESDLRFRAMFEAAAIGIGICELDGRILEANPALSGMLGYSQQELAGTPRIWRGRLMSPTNDVAPQAGELRVLLVEDNELDAELVVQALRKGGFSISAVVVQAEAEFERELRLQRPDVVIADYNLPQWKGMEVFDVLRREGLEIPLILVSGALGDITAVDCIKRGATDYVLKDSLARLPEAVRRALQEKRLLGLRRQAEEDLARKAEELARSNADLEQFAPATQSVSPSARRSLSAMAGRSGSRRGPEMVQFSSSQCPAMVHLRRNCAEMKIRTSSPCRNCGRRDSRLGCPGERSSPAFFICPGLQSRAWRAFAPPDSRGQPHLR